MINYLKYSIFNPKKIHRAKNMKKRQIAQLVALITLFITVISIIRVVPMLQSIQKDGQEIASELPEFNITDGELVTSETNASIHQTNSFLLFFDPNDQMSSEEIDQNLTRLNVPVGVGLLKDTFYLSFLGYGVDTSYDQLESLDSESVKVLLNGLGSFSFLTYAFTFVISYIGIGFIEIFELLFILLFANLFSKLLRSGLMFKQNLRMAIMASVLPTIAIELSSLFNLVAVYAFELKIGLSLFIFYLAVKDMKKTTTPKKEAKT